MQFWNAPFVAELLSILGLLAVVALWVRAVPRVRALGVPNAIAAGLLGIVLGPTALGLLPFDPSALEVLVYHAFALMFIAFGLRSAPRQTASGSSASLTFAVGALNVVQSLLGIGLVGAWWLLSGDALHQGFSWMVTLGFMQGPGVALSLGSAWEQNGLAQGGQIGLIFAALGFGYCVLLGVPLVAVAKRRGWVEVVPDPEPDASASEDARTEPKPAPNASDDGFNEPLGLQVMLIAAVYVATYGMLRLLTLPLPEGSSLESTVFGFHFIVGFILAYALRSTARRTGLEPVLHDDLLARISVFLVDVATVGAVAAVRLDVLSALIGPILFMTATAAVVTLVVCLWSARRLFPQQPFEHALVLFGAATGTTSTALSLLRMIDPRLQSPAARNMVVAANAALPVGAPLFLLVVPISVGLWSGGWGTSLLIPAGILAVYLALLLAGFARFTPARLLKPWTSIWPDR